MSSDGDDLVFKALADSRRRQILDLLKASARTTGELCERFPDLDRCTVMQHIGVLERAGLLVSRREGRQRWNYLDLMPLKELHDRWIAPQAASAVALLARLKRDLEAEDSPARPALGRGRRSRPRRPPPPRRRSARSRRR